MSVRSGVRWRRSAGKICGIVLLVACGAWLILHLTGLSLPGEDWALEAVLLFAAALMLLVAVELSIVSWRLLHPRRRN